MKNVQSQSTSNPAAVSQAAAAAALSGDQGCVARMREAFRERHAFIHDALNKLPGVTAVAADGTFYSFPEVQSIITRRELADDIALAELLLTEAGVAVVPGSAFGAPGHLRLSFATSMDHLHQAAQRLTKLLSQ